MLSFKDFLEEGFKDFVGRHQGKWANAKSGPKRTEHDDHADRLIAQHGSAYLNHTKKNQKSDQSFSRFHAMSQGDDFEGGKFDHEHHINNLKKSVHNDTEYAGHLQKLKDSKPNKGDLAKVYSGVVGYDLKAHGRMKTDQLHRAFETHANGERRDKRRGEIARNHMPI